MKWYGLRSRLPGNRIQSSGTRSSHFGRSWLLRAHALKMAISESLEAFIVLLHLQAGPDWQAVVSYLLQPHDTLNDMLITLIDWAGLKFSGASGSDWSFMAIITL